MKTRRMLWEHVAEVWVMHLSAKECQRLPTNYQNWGQGHGTDSHNKQKEPTLLMPWSWTINCCCLVNPVSSTLLWLPQQTNIVSVPNYTKDRHNGRRHLRTHASVHPWWGGQGLTTHMSLGHLVRALSTTSESLPADPGDVWLCVCSDAGHCGPSPRRSSAWLLSFMDWETQ